MSKFKHFFTQTEQTDTYSIYTCSENTARLDFISDSCVRVAIYKDKNAMLPTFSVNPENTFSKNGRSRLSTAGFSLCAPQVSKTEDVDCFLLPCGVTVEVQKNNFLLSYYMGDAVLFSDRAPLAYNFQNEFGNGTYHYVTRTETERIFGLGDKGGALNKAGRAFRIETTDCMGYNAAESDPLYKHIPFYICENDVGCYGIFYDTADTSYIDLGKEINNYYPPYKYFKTEDDCLVYYVFFGTKLSVLQQFARLCGKQAFPPKWSFDYCASTMAYTDAPDAQQQMYGFLQNCTKRISPVKDFTFPRDTPLSGTKDMCFIGTAKNFPIWNSLQKNSKRRGLNSYRISNPRFSRTTRCMRRLQKRVGS